MDDPRFWESLYAGKQDGWELGRPCPPLEAWLRSHPAPRGRVAALGCGRGHDARLLARHGCEVWGFDFAAPAIEAAQALASAEGVSVRWEQRDLFSLPARFPGQFDGIWEYTCFCAIPPARRAEYVQVARDILRPDGWLLACFYPLKPGTEGPPFPTSEAELLRLLTPGFEIVESYVPTESIDRRRGFERLIFARKSANA
ncbi:MAG: methyltransferase domain-containing protein [Planctomycetes bacterium]|nr:methyltransferase domain-containing protein [Planctomycetota bacterium]